MELRNLSLEAQTNTRVRAKTSTRLLLSDKYVLISDEHIVLGC